MIDKNTIIEVYNEYDGNIYGISAFNDYGYKFERANDFGEPSITPVPFSDVQLINNKSSVFRDGTLRFDIELEEEIYKELRITPNNNYFTKSEIEDMILNTTQEKLDQIVAITSSNTLEKFRTILIKLDNSNEYDIPKRVFDVINARAYELAKGKIKSDIKLVTKKSNKKNENVETNTESNTSDSDTVSEKKTATKKIQAK